jgi:hypothetical protein
MHTTKQKSLPGLVALAGFVSQCFRLGGYVTWAVARVFAAPLANSAFGIILPPTSRGANQLITGVSSLSSMFWSGLVGAVTVAPDPLPLLCHM